MKRIFALVTDQGTAAYETGLCEDHIGNAVPIPDDVKDFEFHDVTGNDAIYCTVCGYRTGITVDVEVQNHGSIFLFIPLTDAAREWIEENVETEPWMWSGGGLAVEHRYAENLAQGMLDAGLEVR